MLNGWCVTMFWITVIKAFQFNDNHFFTFEIIPWRLLCCSKLFHVVRRERWCVRALIAWDGLASLCGCSVLCWSTWALTAWGMWWVEGVVMGGRFLGGCQRSYWVIYRVIHKSQRDFRTRLRNNQDRHGRKEHINR